MLNPRRCGWLSAQQLGMYMLERVKDRGGRLLIGKVADIRLSQNKISGVKVLVDSDYKLIHTERFVNAAGPYVQNIASMIGIDLPVFNELHGKISFTDTRKIVPRHVPLMIWSDPVKLPWSDEERDDLAGDDQTRWLVEEFPAGVHFRPEGLGPSPVLLILWTYEIEAQEPIWPPRFDDFYPEIVLRGLTRMVPGLAAYINRMGKPIVDGGYYCKTQENRPLIGPLPVDGAYIIGALSGYGVMACSAAGELLANHITGDPLPDYANDFLIDRYQRPAYQQLLANWDSTTGQL
jgi:glycine/D-amino acid oxidase-like deaminating enzyme